MRKYYKVRGTNISPDGTKRVMFLNYFNYGLPTKIPNFYKSGKGGKGDISFYMTYITEEIKASGTQEKATEDTAIVFKTRAIAERELNNFKERNKDKQAEREANGEKYEYEILEYPAEQFNV